MNAEIINKNKYAFEQGLKGHDIWIKYPKKDWKLLPFNDVTFDDDIYYVPNTKEAKLIKKFLTSGKNTVFEYFYSNELDYYIFKCDKKDIMEKGLSCLYPQMPSQSLADMNWLYNNLEVKHISKINNKIWRATKGSKYEVLEFNDLAFIKTRTENKNMYSNGDYRSGNYFKPNSKILKNLVNHINDVLMDVKMKRREK